MMPINPSDKNTGAVTVAVNKNLETKLTMLYRQLFKR